MRVFFGEDRTQVGTSRSGPGKVAGGPGKVAGRRPPKKEKGIAGGKMVGSSATAA